MLAPRRLVVVLLPLVTSCASSTALTTGDAGDGGAPADASDATPTAPRPVVIGANAAVTCAVTVGRTLRCWGANQFAQLGVGMPGEARLLPTTITALTEVAGATVTGARACATGIDGRLWCWGLHLLEGEFPRVREAPHLDETLRDAQQVAIGSNHVCVRLRDGTVQCRGHNGYGQLGDGTTTSRTTWAPVRGVTNAASISLGGDSSCALTSDHAVYCWGRNVEGQLGVVDDGERCVVIAPQACRRSPTRVPLGAGAQTITIQGRRACSRLLDDAHVCWGTGLSMLADDTRRVPPTDLGVAAVDHLALGSTHTCLGMRDRTVRCWGQNDRGQLVDGSTVSRAEPRTVPGLRDTFQVALGERHSCAMRSDGAMFCWGANESGQLGDGTTTERHVPTLVRW